MKSKAFVWTLQLNAAGYSSDAAFLIADNNDAKVLQALKSQKVSDLINMVIISAKDHPLWITTIILDAPLDCHTDTIDAYIPGSIHDNRYVISVPFYAFKFDKNTDLPKCNPQKTTVIFYAIMLCSLQHKKNESI